MSIAVLVNYELFYTGPTSTLMVMEDGCLDIENGSPNGNLLRGLKS